ncbi:Inner membrane protein YqaA [Vibrio stylophorae]|uniref:Inner membrane protein YqaA n=2 Tax=Vibrio stylophorae TaxID=659351 RepID=A0ABN8DVL2_9VIBR|nr:Inner membrane protein YqaA [Vibrio stylophorae]
MASSFVSATLFPGGSEALLLWLVKTSPAPWLLVVLASLANTLGGVVNYAIGRWLPQKMSPSKKQKKALDYLQRYGTGVLLLSWLPIIGDLLCVAAGWFRCRLWPSVAFMLIGKSTRYALIAWFVLH